MEQGKQEFPEGVIQYRWYVWINGKRFVTWAESAGAALKKMNRHRPGLVQSVEPAPSSD